MFEFHLTMDATTECTCGRQRNSRSRGLTFAPPWRNCCTSFARMWPSPVVNQRVCDATRPGSFLFALSTVGIQIQAGCVTHGIYLPKFRSAWLGLLYAEQIQVFPLGRGERRDCQVDQEVCAEASNGSKPQFMRQSLSMFICQHVDTTCLHKSWWQKRTGTVRKRQHGNHTYYRMVRMYRVYRWVSTVHTWHRISCHLCRRGSVGVFDYVAN